MKVGKGMELNEICKNAYKLLEKDGFRGLYLILDIGDSLVCYGGNLEEVYYGVRSVWVHKETGKTTWFATHQHEKLINATFEVDIPDEFMYKAYSKQDASDC